MPSVLVPTTCNEIPPHPDGILEGHKGLALMVDLLQSPTRNQKTVTGGGREGIGM